MTTVQVVMEVPDDWPNTGWKAATDALADSGHRVKSVLFVDETTDTAAAVLYAHAWNDRTGRCKCGWYVPDDADGSEIDWVHAEHQAEHLTQFQVGAR